MLYVIVIYYCTVNGLCYIEKPAPHINYSTLSACRSAIVDQARDYLNPHFLHDDTVALWCDDSKKSILSPPDYPLFDGSDEPLKKS